MKFVIEVMKVVMKFVIEIILKFLLEWIKIIEIWIFVILNIVI